MVGRADATGTAWATPLERSEEHTSELQSQSNLVCRLLLEKKKKHVTSSSGFSSPSTITSPRTQLYSFIIKTSPPVFPIIKTLSSKTYIDYAPTIDSTHHS